MTTEEKARAYDEALKDMRAIYPNLKGDAKLAVEHAFPELAESEDERIRKDIMEAVENWHPYERVEDIRAYLEKQKMIAAIPDELVECYKNLCERGNRGVASLINAINGINEQNEQKPAEWSEEDEAMRNNIIRVLSTFVGTVECDSNPSLSSSYPTYLREIDWLKSLRPSWKPSEEQMEALERTIRLANFGAEENRRRALESLHDQLKKLM